MAPITEDKTVTQILTGPSTWVSWHREFTNTMDALKLLEYFQGTKELLTEPRSSVNPLRIMERAQERRKKIAEEKGVAILALTDEELEGATEATLDISTATTPPDSETEGEQASGAPTAAQKRTAGKAVDDYFQTYGLFILQSIQNLHDNRRKDWTAQSTKLDKARTFLNTTVAITLRNAHFSTGGSLRDWYKNLKAVAEARHETISALRGRMSDHYTALKGKAITQADFGQWLTQWETLMGEATMYKLPEVSNEGSWFEDYARAVGPIVPLYAALVRSNRLTNPNLGYREIATEARQTTIPLLPSTTGARIQKGAFPSFNPSDSNESGKASKASHKRKNGTLPTEKAKCRLCHGRHHMERCAYIMPHLAPEGFQIRDHVRERVDQNIASDSSLKAEVERIQNKRTKNPKQQPDAPAQGH